MSEAERHPRVGLVGHRSWIAQALVDRINRDTPGHVVVPYEKSRLRWADFSGLDCLYLILGRARPSSEEEQAERDQVFTAVMNDRQPRRIVYLSSQRLTGSKLACEDMIDTIRPGNVILRPGAVFGPTQDPASPMLVPLLVREGAALELRTPDRPTEFVSLDALTTHMARLADPLWVDPNRCGQPGSMCMIPGTLTASPRQIRDLYLAFRELDGNVRRRTDFLAGVECAESGDIARFGSWDAAADHHVGPCD